MTDATTVVVVVAFISFGIWVCIASDITYSNEKKAAMIKAEKTVALKSDRSELFESIVLVSKVIMARKMIAEMNTYGKEI